MVPGGQAFPAESFHCDGNGIHGAGADGFLLLESAKKNGVTRTEIAEILTHAAFYAGWPKAWAAFPIRPFLSIDMKWRF